ncbi:hypothetical protein, partial [Microcoleus sp. B13-B4]|uniref:hypothetical protein n=1 Tax=Microcoleus sp. B13-B4 TaxID=2818651 RepID=UPI002FD70557
MNDCYKSPPISAQFSVVRFTVNSVALSGASPCPSTTLRNRVAEGSKGQQSTSCLSATGIDMTVKFTGIPANYRFRHYL